MYLPERMLGKSLVVGSKGSSAGVGHRPARAGVPAFACHEVADVGPGYVVFPGCLFNGSVYVFFFSNVFDQGRYGKERQ